MSKSSCRFCLDGFAQREKFSKNIANGFQGFGVPKLQGKLQQKNPEEPGFGVPVCELLKSDICELWIIASIGELSTYHFFIDDFSRNSWVYFMRKKSDALEDFNIFVALVERQSGKKVKALMSDNGGEYCSKEFEAFCKSGNCRA
jgi:transposase InsO family protein